MIVSLQALAPAALLLAGGTWLVLRPSATVFVLLQLATLAAVLRMDALASATLTVPVYQPLPGLSLITRYDALSKFFITTVAGAGVLVSLPWSGDGRRLPYGWLALAQFGAIGAILAGDLPGLAVGWSFSVAALLLMVLIPDLALGLRRPSEAVARTLVLHLGGAAILVGAAVGVEALAGTASFDAIPVGALDSRMGTLLAVPPLLVLATIPGLIRACRAAAGAAFALCAALVPLAVYVLSRAFDLAEGRPLPQAVNVSLVGLGGVGALVYALYALWAPDLGSAISRILGALGMLLVSAFGAGGSGGLAALLVGFVSLEAAAVASLGVVDAGRGRLAGSGPAPRGVLGALSLLALLALAGSAVGLGLDARLLVVRRVWEQGRAGALLTVPMVAGMLAISASAFAAGRFGGGRVDGRRGLLQLGLGAALLVALAGWSTPVAERITLIAAATAHVSGAEVHTTTTASLPGPVPGALLLILAVVMAAGLGWWPRSYSSADGLRWAPGVLPPRLAVTPEIAVRAGVGAVAGRLRGAGGLLRAHARWAVALTWTLATAGVLYASR
ncbi:MAG: hypothetical protein ABR573_10700 [Candidatus Dormibacteria bacterium]